MQAASALLEGFDKTEMHYVIAKTMLSFDYQDNATTSSKSLYTRSRHVCLAVDLIKAREINRAMYRDLLYRAAENACDSGARSTGLYYYTHCLTLLQNNPWDDTNDDVFYQETLRLYARAAECYWYQGFYEAALGLLQTTFAKARDAVDKTPSWILQSRVYAMRGDSFAAFNALKKCIHSLGFNIEDMTREQCDAEFHNLAPRLKAIDTPVLLESFVTTNRELLTAGPVFIELLSAAFWSNSLLFYQITLKMIQIQLEHGLVSQIGLAYVHLASIAVGRFNLTEFGIELGNLSKAFFERFNDDVYTIGRGQTLHALFIGHLQTHVKDQIPILHEAMQGTILAGDRILSLLNLGVVAMFRIWCSDDIAEIEVFIDDASLEYRNWKHDLRGGVFLVSVQQYCRALQGKTQLQSAKTVLSDENHQTKVYLDYLNAKASNPKRPRAIYLSYYLMCLFHYGYLDEAATVGEELLPLLEALFCVRSVYSTLFYISLTHIAKFRLSSTTSEKAAVLGKVQSYVNKIKTATTVSDVNYKHWLQLLDAELADVSDDYPAAIQAYEAALDHAHLHDFTLEEGLIYELYAEFLMRRGGSRLARQMLRESIACYRRVSATGKCKDLNEKYEWLLRGTATLTVADAECQTTIIDTGNTPYKLAQNEDSEFQHLGTETTVDRTHAWLTPQAGHSGLKKLDSHIDLGSGFSAAGLDMIDLTSILESSQVLSSELQVDRLLSKMTEIILETTAADLGAIVIEDETIDWTIATIGTPDGVTSFTDVHGMEKVEDQVAKQITLCKCITAGVVAG
jgi:tetratricopeptide (TPR) repeat protein